MHNTCLYHLLKVDPVLEQTNIISVSSVDFFSGIDWQLRRPFRFQHFSGPRMQNWRLVVGPARLKLKLKQNSETVADFAHPGCSVAVVRV